MLKLQSNFKKQYFKSKSAFQVQDSVGVTVADVTQSASPIWRKVHNCRSIFVPCYEEEEDDYE